jgi:Mor family transcriptional regulator
MAENLRKKHRDQLIYDDYSNLWATGMREELIWPILDKKYHLAESTIYRIVLKITNQREDSINAQPHGIEEI